VRFSKWQALGNAYLLVERAELAAPLEPDEVRRLCDPRYGIGSDGILEIGEVRGAEADVVVWNPDGSRAELSGNGARIAALWLARRSGVAFPRVRLGERLIPARVNGDEVEVDLGQVDVGRPEALELDGERLEFTPVSVGNPHAVLRREPEREELLRLGPLVERHERFPERTNVQLVRADAPGDLTVLVWERGAGETLASGSSAAAAAAAAVTHGWCESPVRVHLPGGTVTVDIREGRAILSGPVVEIAVGETVA
jgi:diaminopimelate epimerase